MNGGRAIGSPDDRLERNLNSRGFRSVAGVDEAGRGSLAGPVTAAAVMFAEGTIPSGVDDSKKLAPQRRLQLYELIMIRGIVSVAHVQIEEIDRQNILWATMAAMRNALSLLPLRPDYALVDGNRIPGGLEMPATSVVKGDQKSVTIAAASIVAKVERDRVMVELAAECPSYGWKRNKGYGTKEHLAALRKHGPSPHHRRSFAPVRNALNSSSGFRFSSESSIDNRT